MSQNFGMVSVTDRNGKRLACKYGDTGKIKEEFNLRFKDDLNDVYVGFVTNVPSEQYRTRDYGY
jgi:hypothetical protein